MTDTSRRTKTPWKVEGCDIYGEYGGRYQLLAATFKEERGKANVTDDGEEARANAAYIVKAVNYREEMLEAVHMAVKRLMVSSPGADDVIAILKSVMSNADKA